MLATEGLQRETAAGNLKAPLPGRKRVIEWILKAWQSLPKEIITKSFRVCALSLPCDKEINCFNSSQPSYSGNELLKSQLSILIEPDENLFTSSLDDEDVNSAARELISLMLIQRMKMRYTWWISHCISA